jgi:hypothetical protein
MTAVFPHTLLEPSAEGQAEGHADKLDLTFPALLKQLQ